MDDLGAGIVIRGDTDASRSPAIRHRVLDRLQVLRSTGELLDAKTLLGLAWAGVALWALPSPR